MPSYELIGTLKVKSDTQMVSEKFSKREFVITTDTSSNYPQFISLQLTQDRCSLLDQFNVGDELKVSFNLRGREWSGPQGIRYFNSLEAWRIERAGQAAPASQPASQGSYSAPGMATAAESFPTSSGSSEGEGDLPF
jgi:hypothetical protein